MMRFFGVLVALALVAASPAAVHAWSEDGHKVVCAIAWDELTPTAQGGIKIILGVDTKTQFVEHCTWADDYAAENPKTEPWHFVPISPRHGTVNINRDCGEPESCAIVQIERNIELVRDGPADLDKSKSLKFLVHLIADVHQPLHVTHKVNDFGAEVRATFMGNRTNLHAIWDTDALVRYGVPWEELGHRLHTEITDSKRNDWRESTPLDWANESLKISRLNMPRDSRYARVVLGHRYYRSTIDDILKRLSQAGVRLGHTLNGLLG